MSLASKMDLNKLNQLYDSAEQKDKETFAEFRSNILLVSGKHYANSGSKYWNRLRDAKDLTGEQRLRITKNHMQKISKLYVNSIISKSPGVVPAPKNEREQSDVKSAELNKSVWHDIRQRHKLDQKIIQYAKDFIDIGEVAVKLFWDPNAGKLLHMEQEVDEMGVPQMNEDGSPKAGKPVFQGDLVFERVFAFNLLIDPDAKAFEDARWMCVRKMVDTEELKAKVGNDPEKLKFIVEGKDETFKVFDGVKGTYNEVKGQTLLREFYFRPCVDYPTGYYIYSTDRGILFEGELPFEIPFPIHWCGFDETQTSSRCSSIIKVARPYQIEINRASSQAAIAQITMGDDKIIYQTGAKMTAGALLPGVRGIQVSGMAPTVLAGRNGEQFYTYISGQINELYEAVMLQEAMAENENQTQDPFTMLFKSMKEKAKYVVYLSKFQGLLNSLCEASLQLARIYYPEEMAVAAFGKSEYINIKEFKTTTPVQYKIEVMPMTDDIESMLGKQLMINHAIQYMGNKLEKEDLGKLLRTVPMANFKESFSDMTLDDDVATNVILAIDRGDNPYIPQYGDKKYLLKRVEARICQADFLTLEPDRQGMYGQVIQKLEMMIADDLKKLQMAESGFIPTGGGRCKVDYYTETRPGKVERATLPVAAVEWLIEKLATQGESQARLMELESGGQVGIAQKLLEQGPSQPPQGQAPAA